MSKEFVVLTLDDFVQWADGLFGFGKYILTKPKNGREVVIKKVVGIFGLELHVYTTVDEDEVSRGSGEDAIRFVLYDRNSGSPVGLAKKVLRVEGETTPFQRCESRLRELVAMARAMKAAKQFCQKCGSHLVERTRQSDNTKFFGCSLYPHCKPRAPLNESSLNAFRFGRYPLVDNPFKGVEVKSLPNPYMVRAPLVVMTEFEQEEQEKEHSIQITGKQFDIASESELVPTEICDLGYPFPYFNRMQSGVLHSGMVFDDANVMLGTATSSGKTVAAELAIAAMLDLLS